MRLGQQEPLASGKGITYLSVGEVGMYGDRPLVRALSKGKAVRVWRSVSAWESADWVAQLGAWAAGTHLVGHGVAGVLALVVAQRFPVRSVALLGVGAYSGLDWQAYAQQQLVWPCGRWVTLARLARRFFGVADWTPGRALAALFDRDLQAGLPAACRDRAWGGQLPPVPVWVAGATDDPVVLPGDYSGWRPRLRPGDGLWLGFQGGHFFHHHHPVLVANELQRFWQKIEEPTELGLDLSELNHDANSDRRFATVAVAAELGGFAFGAPGQPPSGGYGTPARGRVVADRRGLVAGHHLG